MLYEKSRAYYKKNKTNYFGDLARQDKERQILSSKKAAWLATFSPSAANDITGILAGKSSLFDLSAGDIKSFAKDLSRIFSAYWKIGARSANMAIFSAPLDERNKFFTLHARIVSRPALMQFNSSDRGFLEVLHKEAVISTIPEDLAKNMRGAIR